MKYTLAFFLIILFSCSSDRDTIPSVDTSNDNFFVDGEIEIVFENDVENGINVIFMGDAYLKQDLGEVYGKYRNHAIANINHLFETEPFKSYIEYFNAYIVYVESNENVISTTPNDTAFKSTLTPGGVNGFSLLTISDYDNLRFYASKVTNMELSEKELILMSVNNTGRGSATYNSNLAVFGDGDVYIMTHEVGHAFAGLADEYFFDNYDSEFDTTLFPNLDDTDDLDAIKWNHFIGLEHYGLVSAYEGGGYNPTGIWRPEDMSIMRSNAATQSFNAPSREAIVKRILEISGLEYNFQDFLEKDRNNTRHSLTNNIPPKKIICGTQSL